MSLSVENQPEQSRYALLQDGELIGVAEYDVNDEAIVFTHTEVDEAKREKGMASALIRAALDDVRDNSHLRVIATCPYVRSWLSEHPDYADLQKR